MNTIDKLFQSAQEAVDRDDLEVARETLLAMTIAYPEHKHIPGAYLYLAMVCWDMDDLEAAKDNYKNATELRPDYEMASQGLYMTYIELGDADKAFVEMKRYLDDYPAKVYKETLEELLEGLKEGHMEAYSEEIILLATKAGVR